MIDKLAMMLGGRAAEETDFGDITTGASNDIEQGHQDGAGRWSREYGMSEKLGPQTFGEANHEVFLGRDFSANADYSHGGRLRDRQGDRAPDRRGVREGAQHPDRAARAARPDGQVLIERETVDKEELAALLLRQVGRVPREGGRREGCQGRGAEKEKDARGRAGRAEAAEAAEWPSRRWQPGVRRRPRGLEPSRDSAEPAAGTRMLRPARGHASRCRVP